MLANFSGNISAPGQSSNSDGLSVNVTEPNPLLVDPNADFVDVDGFLDNDGATEFFQRQPNPLRLYNSYTYIISLGILSGSEVNNPSSYRNDRGFSKILCRSGGGDYDIRQTTPIEDAYGPHAEYFIEDLELDAVVAPNTNTGITLGHNLSFNVVEPYSMGKFLESMIIAADEKQFPNYTEAPFCLKIEFVGWDDEGVDREYVNKPVYIPIIISKMEFEVTETGSLYRIQANAYTDSALQDHVNQVKTSINVHGSTVHEVLQTGDTSFTFALNDRIIELEERQIVKGYDRFVILFPKKNSNLFDELSEIDPNVTEPTLTTDVENNRPDGTGTETITTTVDYSSANSQIYEYLQEWAQDEANINAIGMSSVRPDPNENHDDHQPEANTVVTPESRSFGYVSPTEDQKEFQARQGTRITDFIENVILESEWAAERVTEDADSNGIRDWFRIETKVFIEPSSSSEIELQIGRPRKIYVFAVYEFENHEARHLNPSQNPRGINYLRNVSKKEYNYIYTGKNEDVLDFKINFNLAFANNMYADFGQNQGGRDLDTTFTQDAAANIQSDGGGTTSAADNGEFRPTQEQVVNYNLPHYSGSRMGLVRARKAAITRTYHNRLVNSESDMIQVEIDIWGDPYFLPADQGNYNSQINTFGLTEDGTMSYLRNEVYSIVNFKTPLDYEVNGYLMTPSEASANFSGVYQVMSATSMFREGKFTQTLGLVRIPGQNNPEGTINDPTISETNDPNNDLYQDERQPSELPDSLTPGLGGSGAGSGVTTPVENTPVQGNQPSQSVLINGQIFEVGDGPGQIDRALAEAAGAVEVGFNGVDRALAEAVDTATQAAGNAIDTATDSLNIPNNDAGIFPNPFGRNTA